jgi:hypothetical protein
MNIPQIDPPADSWINGKPTSPLRLMKPQTGKKTLVTGCGFFDGFDWNLPKMTGIQRVD